MYTEKTTPSVLSASTIINTSVEKYYGENLGKIETAIAEVYPNGIPSGLTP